MYRLKKQHTILLVSFLLTQFGIAQNMNQIYKITQGVSGSQCEFHTIEIPCGKEVVLADIKGPGKITYFYITDGSDGRFYQGLVLKVFWDNNQEPSINVPLGDFFGAIAGKEIEYQSLPMQINHRCYMCYLPMPFSQRAKLVLANDGDKPYLHSVAYGIDYELDRAYSTNKSRLHCSWKRSNPTKDGMHEILNVIGKGHYIGGFLEVFSRYKGWWGEGDTIFFVDGKKITHSPGTEDEYGSCWGFVHTYSYIYSGYILMDKGYNRMYRWYLTNPIRFQKSLGVAIQNQRFEDGQKPSADDYKSVAFWYQDGSQGVTLQSYEDHVAESKAAEYKQ